MQPMKTNNKKQKPNKKKKKKSTELTVPKLLKHSQVFLSTKIGKLCKSINKM